MFDYLLCLLKIYMNILLCIIWKRNGLISKILLCSLFHLAWCIHIPAPPHTCTHTHIHTHAYMQRGYGLAWNKQYFIQFLLSDLQFLIGSSLSFCWVAIIITWDFTQRKWNNIPFPLAAEAIKILQLLDVIQATPKSKMQGSHSWSKLLIQCSPASTLLPRACYKCSILGFGSLAHTWISVDGA